MPLDWLVIGQDGGRAGTTWPVYHYLIDFEEETFMEPPKVLYQRSLDIETRLDDVLRLIRHGAYSTPKLAEKLGVSIPTVSRDVTALRQRGHDIRSQRAYDGWRYVLNKKPPNTARPMNAKLKEARL
jgi:biotin operon repressor